MKNGWIITHTVNHEHTYDAACDATCNSCGAVNADAAAHTWADATCTAPKTCSVCKATEGKPLDHTYVDGTCSCGAKEPVAGEEVTAKVVLADLGFANSTLYDSFNVDDNVKVSVTATPVGNYGQNSGKYYTSGAAWRIYQNEKPQIVIAAEGKTIVSVKITYTVDKTGVLTLNGENVASDTVIEVNASSITFSVGNTGTVTNGQVRISAIEVVYK
jgi:hypothetical protein